MFTLKNLTATELKLLSESIAKNLHEKSQIILSYNKLILDNSTLEEDRKICEIRCNSIRKECSQLQSIKNKIDQKIKTYIG